MMIQKDGGYHAFSLAWRVHIIIVLMVFLVNIHVAASNGRSVYCPNPGGTTELQFSKTPARQGVCCSGQYTELHCCVKGFDRMSWYQWISDRETWEDFDYYNTRFRSLTNHNQTAVFKTVVDLRDEGMYKCVASQNGSGKYLQHEVRLRVEMCFDWKKPPLPILPSESNTEYRVRLGYNHTMECQGFFGSPSETDNGSGDRSVRWMDISGKILNSNCTASRVCVVHNQHSQIRELQELVLHIRDIRRSDLGTYKCVLANRFGKVKQHIMLLEAGAVSIDTRLYRVIMGVISAIVVVTILIAVIMYAFWPDIRLAVKLIVAKPKLSLDKEYDIFLVYNDQDEKDRDFSIHTLLSKLEALEYTVFLAARDFLPGAFVSEGYTDAVANSNCILFVMSPAFLQDQWCEFAFNHALNSPQYRHHMVFLQFQPIKDTEWKNYETLQMAVRIGPKLVWPKSRSSWTEKRFWKNLQLKLPSRLIMPEDSLS